MGENKVKRITIFIVAVVVLASCTFDKIPRNYIGKVDSGKYIDIAKEGTRSLTKDTLITIASGTYYNEESMIKIDAKSKTIQIKTSVGRLEGDENLHMIDGTYLFSFNAASDKVGYLRHSTRKGLRIKIDGKEISGDKVPDFVTCIPLYGYGENRIEVSSIMDGYMAMPSGTYWKTAD